MSLQYDLHTHILPGIDDGANTVEESLALIESLKREGVHNICFTPHFYTHKEDIKDFLRRRNEAFRELKPYLPDDVNVKLGAEVYVTRYLFSEERDFTPLCIEGTPYMITEFSYQSTFSENTLRMISRIRDFGIIPILPHVERYPALLKKKSPIHELASMGVIIQSNASSFVSSSNKRKLINLAKMGYIDVLSTDAHSLTRNSPANITPCLEIIKKKCGEGLIRVFNENAESVFKGL